MSASAQVEPKKGTTHSTKPSTSNGTSAKSSVKSGLRGTSFDEGEKMLTPKHESYGKSGTGTKKTKGGVEHSTGTGVGWGNRKGDLAKEPTKDDPHGKRDNAHLKSKHAIPQAELDNLPTTHLEEEVDADGSYSKHEIKSGSYSGGSSDVEVVGQGISGPNYSAQTGASATIEKGIHGEGKNDYGSGSYDGKVYATTQAGASSTTTTDENGFQSENAIGAGVTTGAEIEGTLESNEFEVLGQKTTASVTGKLSGSVTAAAGAECNVYATKDKQGVELGAAAGVIAELKLTVTGDIGPVKGTGGVSLTAGVGAGANFAFVIENGKLRIGGGVYASLGFGLKGSFSVEIDLLQASAMAVEFVERARAIGVKGAEIAFKALDADGDGKITPNDAATHAANLMKGAAVAVDKTADGVIGALDGDGDGKFDVAKDLGARGKQAADYVADKTSQAASAGKAMLDADKDGQLTTKDLYQSAVQLKQWQDEKLVQVGETLADGASAVRDYGEQQIDQVIQGASILKDAADLSGDGEVGFDDAAIASKKVLSATGDAISSGTKAIGNGIDASIDTAKQAGKVIGSGIDATVDGAKQAGKAVHKAADRDGNGKLELADVKAGVVQAKQAIDKSIQDNAKAVVQGYQVAKAKAAQTIKAVYDAADLNKDGKVDAKDAVIAKNKAIAAAKQVNQQAKKTAVELYNAYNAANAALAKKAQQAKQAIANAADLNKDGKVDAKDAAIAYQRAQQLKAQAQARALAAYKATNAALAKAGATLVSGYDAATAQLGATYDKLANFFGD